MNANLESLASPRRSDAVAERLRGLILTGVYAVGSRLPNERESVGVARGQSGLGA